ncbi:MAG: toxic anion resistance protein [Clostridiales bacterium]
MGFSMEVTNEKKIKDEIIDESKPIPEEIKKLKNLADNNVSEIMKHDNDSLEKRREILKTIDEFGKNTMKSSSSKCSMLQVSVSNFQKMGDDGGIVAKGLLDLQREIKDLDPSAIDFAKKGILGRLFNPIRSYFAKFQKADSVISDIVESLNKGKLTLKNDNTTLEIEQDELRKLTKKLNKEIELGSLMDETLTKQIEKAKLNNEDHKKVSFISEEILYPLRQKIMDMQQMIVVNQQGYIASEVVIRNNKELIRGVDRAENVTVSALKTATIVAGALYNQKIVLKKIDILNKTTSEIISSTSKLLKEQGTEIQKQSMESNISVDKLKQSFNDVISALNTISTYKQEALPKMKEAIDQFKDLTKKGEEQIQKLENRQKLT